MSAHQRDWRSEIAAGMSPPEFGVSDIALVAIRYAKIFPDSTKPIKLVLGHVLGHPVAAIIGEVELVRERTPIEAHGVAHT